MNTDTFLKLSYGLYIVTTANGDILNGHVSNTVFQVASNPPKFAICTHKENASTVQIRESGAFCVNILEKDVDLDFLGPWGFQSGDTINKFENIQYTLGQTKSPILFEKNIGYIDCKVDQEVDVGSHIMFIGEAIDADLFKPQDDPLTYDFYRNVIKGLSPEKAPTYMEGKKEEKTDSGSKKYMCLICGYYYDEEFGDPLSGVEPGTKFEDVPDGWLCPVCSVGKSQFEERSA